MSASNTKTVARGAMILVLANLVVKIIGIFYKVPITNLLGPLNMAYFNAAFEVQQVLLTVSLALPVAVSKMVAESASLGRGDEVRRIFRVTLVAFSALGLLTTAIFILGAPSFAATVLSEKAKFAMYALAPSLFLYAIAATFRGLYQGLGNMLPTAVTQITEAVMKMLLGTLIAWMMLRAGFAGEYLAAGAISGTTLGIVFSLLILIPLYFLPKTRKRMTELPRGGPSSGGGVLLLRLFSIAIPVTLSSLIVNLTSFLDLFCISNRLQAIGMTEEAAATVYGGYKSYAQLLFNLPPSLIASLGLGILPAIAAAHVAQEYARRGEVMRSGVRMVVLLAMPCAAGLAVLADPILHTLFRSFPEEVSAAVPLMRMLGVASFFACVAAVSTSCLQGINRVHMPLLSLAVGGAVKLACNFILVGIPSIGIYGAPIGTCLCYIVICVINYGVLRRSAGLRLPFVTILKAFAAAAVMSAAGWGLCALLRPAIGLTAACLLSIFVSAAVYGAALIALRAVTAEDLALLPKGERIAGALRRRGFVK